jgi:hypothetical protein
MGTDHFTRFLPAACAGFGLFLAGAVNLLLLHRSLRVRVLGTSAAAAVAVAAAWSLDHPGLTAATARLLTLGLVPYLLVSSRRAVARIAAMTTALHAPAVRFGLLAATGIGLAIASLWQLEVADEEQSLDVLDALAETESVHSSPAVPTRRARAATDKGTPITLKEPLASGDGTGLSEAEERILHNTQLDSQIIRRGSPGDQSNCHGWVFTGGRFQVPGAEVDLILNENGYREVDTPRPRDLVVYRNEGAVTHTAVVRYVAEGQPVIVEGKWGNLGVYLHSADHSLYGTDYKFYRSARSGHLLSGFGDFDRPAAEIRPIPPD